MSFLWKLMKAGGGPLRLSDLGLTTSEHGNSNKIQFFGLAVRVDRDETKTCKWLITRKGIEFLKGDIAVDKRVWTLSVDGDVTVIDREGSVFVHQVDSELQWRADYAREASERARTA
ncbi:MAG: hypothetical protein AABN95_08055 [Acidobacteriota bacterium]